MNDAQGRPFNFDKKEDNEENLAYVRVFTHPKEEALVKVVWLQMYMGATSFSRVDPVTKQIAFRPSTSASTTNGTTQLARTLQNVCESQHASSFCSKDGKEFCPDPFATKACDGDQRPWIPSIKERLETYPDFRGLDFCGQENGLYDKDPAEKRMKRLLDQFVESSQKTNNATWMDKETAAMLRRLNELLKAPFLSVRINMGSNLATSVFFNKGILDAFVKYMNEE